MAPPLTYIIDSSAIIQSPEVLATARRLKLLIPKAVLSELTGRGREHVRGVIGSLINDALKAGAQIVDAPAKLREEPIASDRNAQRLSSVDMDIARIAVDRAERGMPVCVVTLDRALIQFLESRSVRSITPTDFLAKERAEPVDQALLSSAQSLNSTQKRYMALSAIVGAAVSLAATAAYLNAARILETVSVWGTVAALLTLGIGLFWYRQRYRLSYGIFEFMAGAMMSIYVFFPRFDYAMLGVAQGLQVLAGLYVMVRGLDNVNTGLQGTKLEARWNQVFGRS